MSDDPRNPNFDLNALAARIRKMGVSSSTPTPRPSNIPHPLPPTTQMGPARTQLQYQRDNTQQQLPPRPLSRGQQQQNSPPAAPSNVLPAWFTNTPRRSEELSIGIRSAQAARQAAARRQADALIADIARQTVAQQHPERPPPTPRPQARQSFTPPPRLPDQPSLSLPTPNSIPTSSPHSAPPIASSSSLPSTYYYIAPELGEARSAVTRYAEHPYEDDEPPAPSPSAPTPAPRRASNQRKSRGVSGQKKVVAWRPPVRTTRAPLKPAASSSLEIRKSEPSGVSSAPEAVPIPPPPSTQVDDLDPYELDEPAPVQTYVPEVPVYGTPGTEPPPAPRPRTISLSDDRGPPPPLPYPTALRKQRSKPYAPATRMNPTSTSPGTKYATPKRRPSSADFLSDSVEIPKGSVLGLHVEDAKSAGRSRSGRSTSRGHRRSDGCEVDNDPRRSRRGAETYRRERESANIERLPAVDESPERSDTPVSREMLPPRLARSTVMVAERTRFTAAEKGKGRATETGIDTDLREDGVGEAGQSTAMLSGKTRVDGFNASLYDEDEDEECDPLADWADSEGEQDDELVDVVGVPEGTSQDVGAQQQRAKAEAQRGMDEHGTGIGAPLTHTALDQYEPQTDAHFQCALRRNEPEIPAPDDQYSPHDPYLNLWPKGAPFGSGDYASQEEHERVRQQEETRRTHEERVRREEEIRREESRAHQAYERACQEEEIRRVRSEAMAQVQQPYYDLQQQSTWMRSQYIGNSIQQGMQPSLPPSSLWHAIPPMQPLRRRSEDAGPMDLDATKDRDSEMSSVRGTEEGRASRSEAFGSFVFVDVPMDDLSPEREIQDSVMAEVESVVPVSRAAEAIRIPNLLCTAVPAEPTVTPAIVAQNIQPIEPPSLLSRMSAAVAPSIIDSCDQALPQEGRQPDPVAGGQIEDTSIPEEAKALKSVPADSEDNTENCEEALQANDNENGPNASQSSMPAVITHAPEPVQDQAELRKQTEEGLSTPPYPTPPPLPLIVSNRPRQFKRLGPPSASEMLLRSPSVSPTSEPAIAPVRRQRDMQAVRVEKFPARQTSKSDGTSLPMSRPRSLTMPSTTTTSCHSLSLPSTLRQLTPSRVLTQVRESVLPGIAGVFVGAWNRPRHDVRFRRRATIVLVTLIAAKCLSRS